MSSSLDDIVPQHDDECEDAKGCCSSLPRTIVLYLLVTDTDTDVDDYFYYTFKHLGTTQGEAAAGSWRSDWELTRRMDAFK